MKISIIASKARSLVTFRGPLIRELVRAGQMVTTYAPDPTDEVVSALSSMGVSLETIPLSRTGMNVFQDLETLRWLYRLFRETQPDMVFSYTIKPVIYGSIAATWASVPKIYSMITGLGYTFTDTSLRGKLIGQGVRFLYRRALRTNTAIFFQNPDDRDLFISEGIVKDQHKAVVINGSGVDLDFYSVARPKTEPLTFLLIARLIRDKGIVEYVEAARKLKRLYPQCKFRIVGPFDSNPSAIDRSIVQSWQDEGVIEYLGATSDVRPFIADSSVYVLPSYREGTPRTVLEAMAMGRPIVTTDAPGCRETVVQGKNGFLVKVRDSDSLAAAMERFIENPHLIPQMGAESRRLAEEKYDVHKVNASILRVMGIASY